MLSSFCHICDFLSIMSCKNTQKNTVQSNPKLTCLKSEVLIIYYWFIHHNSALMLKSPYHSQRLLVAPVRSSVCTVAVASWMPTNNQSAAASPTTAANAVRSTSAGITARMEAPARPPLEVRWWHCKLNLHNLCSVLIFICPLDIFASSQNVKFGTKYGRKLISIEPEANASTKHRILCWKMIMVQIAICTWSLNIHCVVMSYILS